MLTRSAMAGFFFFSFSSQFFQSTVCAWYHILIHLLKYTFSEDVSAWCLQHFSSEEDSFDVVWRRKQCSDPLLGKVAT